MENGGPPPRLALAFALASMLALAGCASGPTLPTGPVSVHIVHRYQNTTADTFGIPADAGVLHVTVTLENFYKNRCPGPVAQVRVKDPSGGVLVELATENLPFNDCVYTFEKNQTLAKGFWVVEYAGGSDSLGSIVDIRPAVRSSTSG